MTREEYEKIIAAENAYEQAQRRAAIAEWENPHPDDLDRYEWQRDRHY